MSMIVLRGATAFSLICGTLLASGAVFAFSPSQTGEHRDPSSISRAGFLTPIPGDAAYVSRRGEVFRPSRCSAVKDAQMDGN